MDPSLPRRAFDFESWFEVSLVTAHVAVNVFQIDDFAHQISPLRFGPALPLQGPYHLTAEREKSKQAFVSSAIDTSSALACVSMCVFFRPAHPYNYFAITIHSLAVD